MPAADRRLYDEYLKRLADSQAGQPAPAWLSATARIFLPRVSAQRCAWRQRRRFLL